MKLRSTSLLLLSLFGAGSAWAQGSPAAPADEKKPAEGAPEPSSDEGAPVKQEPSGAGSENSAEAAPTEPGDAAAPSEAVPPTSEGAPPSSARLAEGDQPPPLQGPAGDAAPTGRAAPASPPVDDDYELNGDPTVDNLEPVKEPSLFMVALLWDTSMPLGATSDFVNTFSAQGFSIEVKYLGFGNLVVGGLVAWHTIAKKGQYEETVDNVTVSGTMMREFSGNPLLARVHYTFRDGRREDQKGIVVPYVAGGAGGSRVMRRTDFGISVHSEESWRWALVPEVGIEYALKPVTVLAAIRLNYLFSNGSSPEELYLNFSVGVGLE